MIKHRSKKATSKVSDAVELFYVGVATLLVVAVILFAVQKTTQNDIYEEFDTVNAAAYNIYQDIVEFASNQGPGARKSIIIDENTELGDGTLRTRENDEQINYDLEFFMQGTACTGENEIVKLVEGIAICCGKCDSDIRLAFPNDIMCSQRKDSWIGCNAVPEGTIQRIALSCSNLATEAIVSDASDDTVTRKRASAKWGEYMVFPIDVSLKRGQYTVSVCEQEYTINVVPKSLGGGGGGGGGGQRQEDGGQTYACSDGTDNDNDGATDYPADFSCSSAEDNDETNPFSQCQDGIDNDDDGFTDTDDLGCVSAQTNSENQAPIAVFTVSPETATGPAEFEFDATSSEDPDGYPDQTLRYDWDFNGDGIFEISDGEPIQNYYYSTINPQGYLVTLRVTDEFEASSTFDQLIIIGNYQCSDGIDNDNDGSFDFPYDFSCTAPNDNDESNPLSQCQDGIDNDGDSLIDFPQDPDCQSAQDDQEQFTDFINVCDDITKEQHYFENLDIQIFTQTSGNNNGLQDFTLRKGNDIIRIANPNQMFYERRDDGSLQISYVIEEAECSGGVDLTFTVSNPSSVEQQVPYFKIDGINILQDEQTKFLWLKEGANMRSVSPEARLLNNLHYPTDIIYSPVIVTSNQKYAVGASFNYPYLDYKHTIKPAISRPIYLDGPGPWRYNFNQPLVNVKSGSSSPATVAAGETRTYQMSLRVTQPRYWIFTLQPYKEYFNSLYDEDRSAQTQGEAIRGLIASIGHQYNEQTNPKGFRSFNNQRPDIDGWSGVVDYWINDLSNEGWKRTMIWAISGVYNPDQNTGCNQQISSGEIVNCNYPPQIMTHWNQPMLNTENEFLRFEQSGINLGFWYGHGSSKIPVPDTWPPTTLERFDQNSAAHRDFVINQIRLARQRGAKEIGLDAFSMNEVYVQYSWIDALKQEAPEIKFMREYAGNDIINTKVSVYHWDRQIETVTNPNYLARYLNPNSEFIVFARDDDFEAARERNIPLTSQEIVQQYIRWGYTPLIMESGINAGNLEYSLSGCMDGIDNDNDGMTDWPLDQDCAGYEDDSELSE